MTIITRRNSMKVHELIALLSGADPEAIVLIFPPYADPSDGGPVWDVVVEEHAWTRETGLCQGRRYETFYPWGPDPEAPAEATTEEVWVVLIGEELGNIRPPQK